MSSSATSPPCDAGPSLPGDTRWRRVEGVRTHGAVEGSGMREVSYLIERADGQMLVVSQLLHRVLAELDLGRSAGEVARAVSAGSDRELTVTGLTHLIQTKLVPMGLVTDAAAPAGTAPLEPRANPLLSLRLHGVLLPARLVRRLAAVLAPAFWPPVVVAAVAGLIWLDVTLWRSGSLTTALDQVLATPAFLLALMGLLALGALIHELGHAAACRYGGAEPGNIGVGMYLVFPAFYTDVTQSYRLGRAGRIRTDLGGLYFNVWCLLAAGVGHLITGSGLLLLMILLMHIQMAQQLIPTVRFDGYFVLADLAGVPDLFARVRPILASLRPGRQHADPRVTELRPAARLIITGWVLMVVPTLALALGWMLYHLPQIVAQTIRAVLSQAHQVAGAWSDHNVIPLLLAVISIPLLLLPLVGFAMVLPQLALIPIRLAVTWWHKHATRARPAS